MRRAWRMPWLLGWFALVSVAGAAGPQALSVSDGNVPAPAGGNADSVAPVVSADGRFVLFTSLANDLVPGGNSQFALNLYLRDRTSNTTVLVSANINGLGGGNGSSICGQVSTNGRYVVFQSDATDLLPGDTNGVTDVFVRDVQTGSNILVSVAVDEGWGNGASTAPAITPDGRYVAFLSEASNLVPGDTNGIADVFVRDLVNQTTTLASVGAVKSSVSPSSVSTILSAPPAITPDGREVTFFSSARGLVPGVPSSSAGEVYARDLAGSSTVWVSSNAPAISGYVSRYPALLAFHPTLTENGRFVAFKLTDNSGQGVAAIFRYDLLSNSLALLATNGLSASYNDDVYGPEMTPDGRFIVFATGKPTSSGAPYASLYLADLQAGTNVLVSVCQDGTWPTNSISESAALSPDGRYVAFLSTATNLVGNAVSNGFHVYLRDTVSGTTMRVDTDTNGIGSTDQYGNAPSLSGDGRWVAFACPDGALFDRDNNHAMDVILRDTFNSTNELISRRAPTAVSATGNGFSSVSEPSLTPNGRWLAFSSYADDLVTNDFNRAQDIFVRDLVAGTTTLISAGLDGDPALGGDSSNPVISTNGRFVAFTSVATNLVPNYTNLLGDVFLRDQVAGTNCLVSVSTNRVSAGNGASSYPAMSLGGRYVAFLSTAPNLVSPPTGTGWNVFWRDTVAGVTVAVTTNFPGSTPLFGPSLSGDGRYVAYCVPGNSVAVWDSQTLTNIFPPPVNAVVATSAAISPKGGRLLYQAGGTLCVADLPGKTNFLTVTTSASIQGRAQWSADERFFAFVVRSNAAGFYGTNSQVCLGDLSAGTIALVSGALDGSGGGDGPSDFPAMSGDGRYVVYRSSASNIAPGPLPASAVVLHDRAAGSNTVLNVGAGGDWSSWASRPLISASGQSVVFQSCQSVLAPLDFNRLPDLFAEAPDVTLDSDGDGLPDWWMTIYFGHATGQASDQSRAADDADGDGFTNLQEFLTGTSPTDPESCFHLRVSMAAAPSQGVVLSWPAIPGRSYRLQYKNDLSDLSDPVWQDAGAVVAATSSGSLTVTGSQPAVYYRIILIN